MSDGYGALLDAVHDLGVHDFIAKADFVMEHLEEAGYTVVRNNEKKLSPAQVRTIRANHKIAGWSQADLASIYGINPATVSRIVRGEYW